MDARKRTRLSVEALECRAVPAVTAGVTHGDLVITGDPAAASHLTVTASDANGDKVADTFVVKDGTTTVGTFNGVNHDVIFRLGKGNDAVTLDLGGLSAPHDVRADLGGGTNSLTVGNGTVKGALVVRGGAAGSTLELLGGATVKGDVLTDRVGTVKLDAGSTVGDNVIDQGDGAADALTVAGKVGGDVIFLGGRQADTFTVTGAVGGSVFAFLGDGNDVAKVGGTIGGALVLDGGPGKDALTLSGTVGGHVDVIGGGGGDAVTVAATAQLKKASHIELGNGNDTFTLNASAALANLVVHGGHGTDTFVGNKAQAGLKLLGF
jgi:hypothetical protein